MYANVACDTEWNSDNGGRRQHCAGSSGGRLKATGIAVSWIDGLIVVGTGLSNCHLPYTRIENTGRRRHTVRIKPGKENIGRVGKISSMSKSG